MITGARHCVIVNTLKLLNVSVLDLFFFLHVSNKVGSYRSMEEKISKEGGTLLVTHARRRLLIDTLLISGKIT